MQNAFALIHICVTLGVIGVTLVSKAASLLIFLVTPNGYTYEILGVTGVTLIKWK